MGVVQVKPSDGFQEVVCRTCAHLDWDALLSPFSGGHQLPEGGSGSAVYPVDVHHPRIEYGVRGLRIEYRKDHNGSVEVVMKSCHRYV